MIKDFMEILIEYGWTQKQIAEKTGIAQNMISNFLKGKTCTVETLIKIAKGFGISTDEVLGLVEVKNPEKLKPKRKTWGNSYSGDNHHRMT